MAKQNDNTVLCKADLKAYHEKILPYLGGNMMMQTGVSDYYSTDEKIVGIWTNGKPIYKRTFTVEVPSGTSKTNFTQVNLSTTSNPEVIVDSNIVIDYFNNNSATPHWKDDTPQEDEAFVYVNPNLLALSYRVQSQLHINIHATAYYTKTTDAANSALTTPGCYDINRPDLWPANKEIFFGNGLYGYRLTNNTDITIAAGGQYDSAIIATVSNIINNGGKAYNKSGGWAASAGTCSLSDKLATGFYYNNTGDLKFFIENQNSQSKVYNPIDVWVTYTK